VQGEARPNRNQKNATELIAQMQENLVKTKIFGESCTAGKSDNLAYANFKLSAKILDPYVNFAYDLDHDFARWTLQYRQAGEKPPEAKVAMSGDASKANGKPTTTLPPTRCDTAATKAVKIRRRSQRTRSPGRRNTGPLTARGNPDMMIDSHRERRAKAHACRRRHRAPARLTPTHSRPIARCPAAITPDEIDHMTKDEAGKIAKISDAEKYVHDEAGEDAPEKRAAIALRPIEEKD